MNKQNIYENVRYYIGKDYRDTYDGVIPFVMNPDKCLIMFNEDQR